MINTTQLQKILLKLIEVRVCATLLYLLQFIVNMISYNFINLIQRFSTDRPQQVLEGATQSQGGKILKSYILRLCFVVKERFGKVEYGMKVKTFFVFTYLWDKNREFGLCLQVKTFFGHQLKFGLKKKT